MGKIMKKNPLSLQLNVDDFAARQPTTRKKALSSCARASTSGRTVCAACEKNKIAMVSLVVIIADCHFAPTLLPLSGLTATSSRSKAATTWAPFEYSAA